MATYYTLSFSENSKGWPSFYTYKPEMMVGMNNYFYSFSGGSLWRHNSTSVPRNNFYGISGTSIITSVINERPLSNKLFKTLELNSTGAWSVAMTTDLPNVGEISTTDFEKKEGDFFSYIRTTGANPGTDAGSEQYKQRSMGGIGDIDTSTPDPAICPNCYVVTYLIDLPPMLSVGDAFYVTNQISGLITDINFVTNTIVVDYYATLIPAPPVPAPGLFSYYAKSITAESHGLLGHYLEFTLTNTSGGIEELFAVKSDYMKSFP